MRRPVEIEFAATMRREKDKTGTFYLLQIRPIVDTKEMLDEDLPAIPADQVLLRSNNSLGHGIMNEIHDNINREGDHRTVINLPDGRTIRPKDFFFLSSKDTLNGTAKQLIINARELLDEDRDTSTTNMEDLKPAADKIIDTYQEAADLKENYKFYVNEKGQFVAEKVEKEEQQNQTTQTREDDEER